MHRPSQVPNAFSVNNADLVNAASMAFGKVIRNKRLEILRPESMQVEHSINRQWNGLVHDQVAAAGR
jgi:hypothetical protein